MTTIISTKQLRQQKKTLIAFNIFFIAMGIILMGMAFFEGEYMILFTLPLCIILPVQFFKDLKRIKSISFDDDTIYYNKLSSAKVKTISFENIRSITIGRFDSNCRINLISANEDGPHLYFKYPVFWIPFFQESKLEQLYKLRDKIDSCKKRNDSDFTAQTQIIEMAQLN